ncbi:hypothetical protein FRB90_011695, partial [Tulasnella sp. 427]
MFPAGFMRARKESSASVTTQTTQATTSKPSRAKSPAFSTTTAASEMPLSPGVVITRADLRASIKAYDELVGALAAYRTTLTTVLNASAKVARALENCSRLKGISDDAACGLQAAGGLHHVIANHEQVLGHSLQVNCEQPLRQHLDAYRAAVSERSAAYERTLMEKSRVIRQTEKENLNLGRKKHRDLNSFRKTLAILQAQVDDLDRLKADYYESVLSHEEQVWDFVLGKVSYSVRATLDVYDRVTTKASDSNLESMLLAVPDPFDTYGPQKSEEHIFSILPPLALSMNSTSSPAPSSVPLHPHSHPHSTAPLSAPPLTNGGLIDNLLTPSASPASSSSPPSPPFIGQSPSSGPSWMHPFQGTSAAATLVSGSAEWADAPVTSETQPSFAGPSSTSPPRRSTYPFTNSAGRASTPPKSVSRAESKLRTVLSAASEDETSASERSSRGAAADGDAEDSDDTGTEVNFGAGVSIARPNNPRRSTAESRRRDNASEETAIWRRSKTPVNDNQPPGNVSESSSSATFNKHIASDPLNHHLLLPPSILLPEAEAEINAMPSQQPSIDDLSDITTPDTFGDVNQIPRRRERSPTTPETIQEAPDYGHFFAYTSPQTPQFAYSQSRQAPSTPSTARSSSIATPTSARDSQPFGLTSPREHVSPPETSRSAILSTASSIPNFAFRPPSEPNSARLSYSRGRLQARILSSDSGPPNTGLQTHWEQPSSASTGISNLPSLAENEKILEEIPTFPDSVLSPFQKTYSYAVPILDSSEPPRISFLDEELPRYVQNQGHSDLGVPLNENPLYLEDLGEPEEDSPYPEVRASVSNTDDPDMPCLTFRVWIIGLPLCLALSGINMYLYLRYPAPYIAGSFTLTTTYAAGKLLAAVLPIRSWNIAGYEFCLNPGPFNVKEHTLMCILAGITNNVVPFGIENLIINQLFGSVTGLGLNVLTFDWSQIAWIGSPLTTPFWVQIHVFVAFVVVYWIIVPILYYSDVWRSGHLPLVGGSAYDRFAKPYNLTRVFDPTTSRFNSTAYEEYSPLYLPISFAVTYTMAFATPPALVMQTILHYWPIIYDILHNRKRREIAREDIHLKLMRRYPEVPLWCYFTLFASCLALSIGLAFVQPNLDVSLAAVVLAIALAILLVTPQCYLDSMTGQTAVFNLIAQIIPGALWPENPMTNMESVQGHYMKVPPRYTLLTLSVGVLLSTVFQTGVKEWIFAGVVDVCQPRQAAGLSCAHSQVFYTASIIWGLVGPTRQFGKHGIYYGPVYAMVAG